MSKDDFLSRVTGIPWRNRACSFKAADCWGLVVLYYRHVLGIEIHQTADYESGSDFLTCYDSRALHSRGENGHVRPDAIRTIQKLFTKVEFYQYAGNRNSASARAA